MAQVKLLKIGSDGVATEFAEATDEITLASFTVQGGGPVLSGTGLDMNAQNITDVPEIHSASSLLLQADSGSVQFQSSTDIVEVLNSIGSNQLNIVTDPGGGDVKFEASLGSIALQTTTGIVEFVDNISVLQGSVNVSGGSLNLSSAVGSLDFQSATDVIKFYDSSAAQQGEINVASTKMTIESSVGDLVLLAGSGIVDASTMDLKIEKIIFDDPSTGTINQTAGDLIVDNIMAKERNNVMSTAGAVIFPSITDAVGEVDAFRLPYLAGAPSATPAYDANPGYMVYDSTNKNLYIWDGAAWDNQSTVSSAQSLDLTFVAGENLTAGDAIYIDSAGQAFKADNDSGAASEAIGFALSTVLAAASVQVRVGGKVGVLSGLTAGARYYIGEAGAITSTVPSASGEYIVQMGYAVSATDLVVQVLQLGRRA